LLENLPTETPPEAQKQLAQQALARAQQTAFSSALRLGSWALGLVAAALLFGVKSVPLLACVLTALVAAAGVTWLLGRRPGFGELGDLLAQLAGLTGHLGFGPHVGNRHFQFGVHAAIAINSALTHGRDTIIWTYRPADNLNAARV
jgi:hypothetical protein